MSVTRDDILAAVKSATGDPDTGIVHDITPAIVDAIAALLIGSPVKEKRVVVPEETR